MSTSEYSPLLPPIQEDAASREPSHERDPLLKRKHLNKDCTHWVPLDYKTIIWGHEDDQSDTNKSKGSYIYRFFWGTKKRKRVTLITSAIGMTVVVTAAVYFGYFKRSNIGHDG